ncbi:RidA family protein [Pelagibacterium sediminicola]|uniref:RidA family protein n=1 Tax=Pelagibacterium sediminicola TaxID=2248761 RepID=UPI000E31A259|nr:RidA family protein [Pelagibacterium sediminicola]
MTGKIESRLADLGITLPATSAPLANYVPTRVLGTSLYVSGQVPARDGKDVYTGKLGADYSIEEGQDAARICAINILAHLRDAVGGDLDRVVNVVRLGGFINAVPEFTDHPKVLNGASDLMVEVFGDAGRHARAAVGVYSLPRNVPVEVDAIFEIA